MKIVITIEDGTPEGTVNFKSQVVSSVDPTLGASKAERAASDAWGVYMDFLRVVQAQADSVTAATVNGKGVDLG